MKQVDEDSIIMIDSRADEIAEIMFFQEKQYGKIDNTMVDMEILDLIKDIWETYKIIKTAKFLKEKVYDILDKKNKGFTLSCLN
jgi:hypothetical protein